MASSEVSSGVSNCYVFKSRLQEYAQKFKLPTPIYDTVKEGPSHSSSFQSTVIVNGVRYDSLPGFFNRKAAEQSAAEVALQELAKSSELNQCVSQPVHETGLCKNLLQEYAQKMNYAMPLYHCQRSEIHGRAPHFICTVEIGGIKYTGAATRTKKDAEISAGRTALLAIQSESNNNFFKSSTHLTVLPCQKKTLEVKTTNQAEDTIKTPKAKKGQFKKKRRKGKNGLKISSVLGSNGNQIEAMVNQDIVVSRPVENCENGQAVVGLNVETAASSVEGSLCLNGIGEKVETAASSVEGSLCLNAVKEVFGSMETGGS